MIDTDVSVHGTWQKRGHVSLCDVTAVLSVDNGKCVDFDVLTKSCKGYHRKTGIKSITQSILNGKSRTNAVLTI